MMKEIYTRLSYIFDKQIGNYSVSVDKKVVFTGTLKESMEFLRNSEYTNKTTITERSDHEI